MNEWHLVCYPIQVETPEPLLWPYGKNGPTVDAINWLKANIPEEDWSLKYDDEVYRSKEDYLMCWRGDFIGYLFKFPKDAVRFKLSML